ncbi:2'-5' RNA ligase [Candidatus Terasakiella magnetica]|nr:2'-5' RNA ligase [Candidatus Terasakiella magnetica]
MIRLFVGLELPPDLAGRLSALGFGLPGAHWVAARNLHLTLRFIGEVNEGVAEDIDAALTAVTTPAFPLTLDGLGLFGDRRRAHTLWAGVEHSEALTRLQHRIEAAVTGTGQPPEPRRFSPHISLARIKETPPTRIQDFIAATGRLRQTLTVESFALFRSTLTRNGAEYDVLERYGLSATDDLSILGA